MHQFIPIGNRLIVKKQVAPSEPGKIIIPNDSSEMKEGIVEEVGPGKYNEHGTLIPMTVKKGDHVLLGRYGGTLIKVNGEDRYIFPEDEILCIIRK